MTTKVTTEILKKLRSVMKNCNYVSHPLQAFVIPSCDAHQSEYLASCDERRDFISGFTGSRGTAIVTQNEAAVWVDGRYYIQAAQQLDDNWILMKEDFSTTPSTGSWLCDVLPAGSKVGVDPFLFPYDEYVALSKKLEDSQITLTSVEKNLVDIIWDEQPERSTNAVNCLAFEFTGQSWQEKIAQIRKEMISSKASVLVLTALDQIAWLFNLRGSDITYNPVFFSYAIISLDHIRLFIDESKLTPLVKTSLEDGLRLDILPYESIRDVLRSCVQENKGKIWIQEKSSYALVSDIPRDRRLLKLTPVETMKAIKNEVEIKGAINAHIKDAVALCEFFAWLEKEVPKGKLTEIDAAAYLDNLRNCQADAMGPSFSTISSFGTNAAIIHYLPTPETNKTITTENVYLVDSGGQYRDGTTDVTRTLHFGEPTEFQKKCYTCVLKGVIAASSAVFPEKSIGNRLDSLARQYLWKEGLDYPHGTGHGVGAFLNVHEGPIRIHFRYTSEEHALNPGCILSIEPGYYEENNFGIRIENLAVVRKVDTPHHFQEKQYLGFEQLTLVPFEANLISPSQLTTDEIAWINEYHAKCCEVIGNALKAQGKTEAYQWLLKTAKSMG